jgi:translocation and assembly module TamA
MLLDPVRTMRLHRIGLVTSLIVVALVLACFAALPARAQNFKYRVEIIAPDRLRILLQQHLKIVNRQAGGQLTLEQLRRLAHETPAEIEALAATEGYFSPVIDSSLEESNGWVARFTVNPGPPVRVAEVKIDFTGEITQAGAQNERQRESTRAAWYLEKGTVFRQDDWDKAKRTALQSLLAERFPAAHIAQSEALVDAAAHSAKLAVTLDSGSVYTIGKLQVKGLQRYSESLVERLNPISPGEPYHLAKILEFQQRLQETGYFSSALVTVDTENSPPNNAPLMLTVVEAKAKRMSFGVGYNTDVGARLSFEFQHNNFLDRGWRLKNTIQFDKLHQIATSDIFFPRTAAGYDFRVGANYDKENIQGEDVRRFGVSVARGKIRGNIESEISLQYQYEDQTLNGAPGSIRQAIFPNYSWTQRAVDSLLFPSRGYLLNLQLGAAPRLLSNSESFVRSYGRGTYYLPLGQNNSLILRAEGGYVASKSSDHIPSVFLFRTGGDTSVRGYPFQGIGVQAGNSIVGGRVLGVMSAEVTHWFTPQWGAAAFYDAGDAVDFLADFKLQQGYGLGARWRSPVGPLNLDVAYGEQRREYRLHFSVGLAF